MIILSKTVERYIELLKDEVPQAVQVHALKALATLCTKDDARKLVLTLPGAVDRIVGLLKVQAIPEVLFEVAKFVERFTAGGTNLTDKATVIFLVNVIDHFMILLAQVDGIEMEFMRALSDALGVLSVYPTIRRVVLSHPKAEGQLAKLQRDDPTSASLSVSTLRTLWIINFRGLDPDENITAEFVSSALEADEVDSEHQRVAARIPDRLSFHAASFNEITVDNRTSLASRLVRLLETHYCSIDLGHTADCLQLIDVGCSEEEGQSHRGLVQLRFKALNNYVALLGDENVGDFKRSQACKAIADQIEVASDCTLLTSTCPYIKEKLAAVFDWSEEDAVDEDFEGRQAGLLGSSNYKVRCTFETMRALTLLDPSSEDRLVLSSSEAYRGRGKAKVSMRMYATALSDYDRALKLRPNSALLLCERAYIRAKLSDSSGALNDLQQSININPDNGHYRSELGILKQIMGHLNEALADLNLAVGNVCHSSGSLFHVLKHRGYIKFLLGDEGGARADAEKAILCRTVWHFVPLYNRESNFTTSPLEYLQ